MKNEMKKYYAWVGQNAVCGSPNRVTGYKSYWGDNYVFSNKSDRDEFVETYRSGNPSVFAKACSYKQLRSRNLGLSVREFGEHLVYRETSKVVDEDGRVEWVI